MRQTGYTKTVFRNAQELFLYDGTATSKRVGPE